MRPRFKLFCALSLAGVLAVSACSDSTDSGSVVILHWWKQGGEADAIGALLDLYKRQNPGVGIVDASVDGSALARSAIRSKISEGSPPDTFQANGGWGLMEWVLYNLHNADKTKMEPIDDIAADWKYLVPPEVLDSVSYTDWDKGTHVYAVPLNIHRLNTLFYNKAIFEEFDIHPENWTNLDDLFADVRQTQ